MVKRLLASAIASTSRIVYPLPILPIRIRKFLARTRTWTRSLCTMAESSGQEVIGFTRRGVEARLKKTGYTPYFPSSNVLRINLPAMSLVANDAQGQRQIVCYLMKLFDITTLYWPLPAKDLDEMLILYILNYEMNLHPSLYDESKKWPLVIDNTIEYVKRSSRCYHVGIRQNDQSFPMASCRYLEINVDPETRRPKAFPQWWKDEHRFPEDGPRPQVEDISKPETGVLETERRIHFTDTDENNHTNFVVYARLCLDMFYENVLKKKYPNSSPVFLKGWLKGVKITFKSDTGLGDILNIASWEDGKSPNTFHFEMRKGGEVSTTVSLTFYTSLTDSHL